ncbi:RNA polymerase sigma factor SigF [[Limnothrix rosea] IAM M-220]|uniref:RNA polymerase sigma factor SigF n=1 Tax=[Limnothrix rosea] IAM M-220 TaxID=454133 RepID=UPI000962CD90|nr:RNA polymerase sigma factor SigF [[Limnothrix rosea] IAM M-220]OKH16082.1 RNA polymerase subunit sigma [[Limnothrix rosea] IAM M-220]
MTTVMGDTIKQQTLQLLQQYQQSGDVNLRNKIVNLNIGLVRKEAHHWTKQCNESFDDLLQVGSIGLLRAIERFTLDKGNAFSSFASPYIRGEIQHYLRDKSTTVRIPRRVLQLRRQSAKFIRAFRAEHHRQPSPAEVAEGLEISLAEWQEVNLAYQNRDPLSLDLTISPDDNESVCLGDLVPDPEYKSFQLAMEDRIRLQQGLAQLEERTRKVLEFVFLQDLTQKEAAEIMGVSVITVSRRMKKGLSSLKQILGG